MERGKRGGEEGGFDRHKSRKKKTAIVSATSRSSQTSRFGSIKVHVGAITLRRVPGKRRLAGTLCRRVWGSPRGALTPTLHAPCLVCKLGSRLPSRLPAATPGESHPQRKAAPSKKKSGGSVSNRKAMPREVPLSLGPAQKGPPLPSPSERAAAPKGPPQELVPPPPTPQLACLLLATQGSREAPVFGDPRKPP